VLATMIISLLFIQLFIKIYLKIKNISRFVEIKNSPTLKIKKIFQNII
jgi:hypothetical protein